MSTLDLYYLHTPSGFKDDDLNPNPNPNPSPNPNPNPNPSPSPNPNPNPNPNPGELTLAWAALFGAVISDVALALRNIYCKVRPYRHTLEAATLHTL